MGEGGGEGEIKLEYTPTWIVAVVCSVIVFISLVVERFLHFLGKLLKRKNQKPLFEALQKVKEELMLLGFISLMLVAFQGLIQEICIPPSFTHSMLPCKKEEGRSGAVGGGRRLLSNGGSDSDSAICAKKGKVPLLSVEAIHQLHIFIFVLAATHVILSALTMLLSGAKIRQWKHWEDSIPNDDTKNVQKMVTHVHQSKFIKEHFLGIGKDSMILSWLQSFVKQIYGSVTKSDYTTMRLGFIMAHCKGNPKFDFYKYMVRALEADFKKVVGIRWYLWIFVVIFLLLNVQEWHAYFWIAFIRLILLLVVSTKLEHVITQLANKVAEKHSAIEGELIVIPSDSHFWFHRPRIVLYLIHFILFQNAFEIALFFWILTTYGFNSCIMGQVKFIVPQLIISVIIQLLCSYSTLPLYAICTQMGSSFKRDMFDKHVQEGLVRWHLKVKNRMGRRATDQGQNRSKTTESANASTPEIQLQTLNLIVQKDFFKEEEKSLMEKPKDLDV